MDMEETATDPLAKARAAKAAKREAALTPASASGRRVTERARERAEEDAAMIPTTAEEYRRWERAVALLKSLEPPVEARVIRTPAKMDPKTTVPVKNPRGDGFNEAEYVEGEMAFLDAQPKPLLDRRGNPVYQPYLAISGDDLAKAQPGSKSRNYAPGAKVLLTQEAAQRLSAQGWVELL